MPALLLASASGASAEVLKSADGTVVCDFPGWKAVRADNASSVRAERGIALLSLNRLDKPRTETQLRELAADNIRQLKAEPGQPSGKSRIMENTFGGTVRVLYWNSMTEPGKAHASALFNRGGKSYFADVLDYTPAELLADILPRLGGRKARLFPVSFKTLSAKFRNKDSSEDDKSFFSTLPEAGVTVEIARRGDKVETLRVAAERGGQEGELEMFQSLNVGNLNLLKGGKAALLKRAPAPCEQALADAVAGDPPTAWCTTGRILVQFNRANSKLLMSYYPAP
jgi:hypothetical protein